MRNGDLTRNGIAIEEAQDTILLDVPPQPQPRDNNANAGNAFRTFRVYGEAFENPEQDRNGTDYFITVHMPLNSPVRDLFRAVNGHRMHRMHLPFEAARR